MIAGSKIDVSQLVTAHVRTLRSSPFGGPPSRVELALHFGIPTILGLAVSAYGFGFRQDAINGFLNVFSILTGLLLNVLVLVFTLGGSPAGKNQDPDARRMVIKETFVNICFSVLVAILVVCTCLVASSYMRSVQSATTGHIATFLLVSLTANFVLTILMILKRIFVLMTGELNKTPETKEKTRLVA